MPQRKSIRLKGYDYSLGGVYFITINTHSHQPLFGEIHDSTIQLSQYGEIALTEWKRLPERCKYIELDEFSLLPDHLHGILIHHAKLVKPNNENKSLVPGSLGAIIGAYKSTVARLINAMRRTPGAPVWHRNYYEQIIRNEAHWIDAREYIIQNPSNWRKKKE